MAIINNAAPAQQPVQASNGGIGYLLGIVLLIVAIFVFLYYGLPLMRGANNANTGGTQINVPKQIDINVKNK